MLIFAAELFDSAIAVELLGVDESAKAFFIAAIGQLYAPPSTFEGGHARF